MLNLQKEFEYILHDVMEAHKNINEWFHEFMTDAEIGFEKVVDPTMAKERGIIKVKRLRAEYLHPIWEEIEGEKIHQFVYKSDNNLVLMPPEMVAYVNSGIYTYPDRYTKIPLSWLEKAKVDYRKLKQMEDALVIYRLVRAPERRVFKIEVGNLPKQKAEAYVRSLMNKYRQRKTFNPETGEAGEIYDPQAMIEDFFFPQQNGRGSSVETLPGGEGLGQIDDVSYFRKKLFEGLRVPMSRLSEEAGFSLGDTSDISRDEVRFFKMTQKFGMRFADLFHQIFMTHIRLKGYADEFNIQARDIRVQMNQDNLFQEYLESSMMSTRADIVEKLMQFAEPGEGGEKPKLSKSFIIKRFLKLNVDELNDNERCLEADEKSAKEAGAEGGEAGDGDLGDLGGGSESGDKKDGGLDSFA
jgi:hypothetical protein